MRRARRRRWSVAVAAGVSATAALLVGAAAAWAAPDTSITSAPSAFTSSPSATFQFSSDDPSATFQCRLDLAAMFTACPPAHTISALSEGTHTLAVRAVSAAAGPDPTPASHTWTVDFTPPDTTLTAGPSGLTSATVATFEFTSEAAATFACSLNGAPFSACSSPQSFTGLSDATRTFAVQGIDQAGNVDPSPAASTWTVDATPPETTITSGPSGPTVVQSAVFAFTSEAAATFECALDGGPYFGCSSPLSTQGNGPRTIAIRAVDPAGNRDPTPASRAWQQDTVAPPAPTLLLRPCRVSKGGGSACLPPQSNPGAGFRLAAFQSETKLYVQWSSPGATRYHVKYTPFSPFGVADTVLWKSNVEATGAPFAPPRLGETYCFEAHATDGVGNVGPEGEKVCTTFPYKATQLKSAGMAKKRGPRHYAQQYLKGGHGSVRIELRHITPFGTLEVGIRRIVLVVTKCRGCGKVRVRLSPYPAGGVPLVVKVIDLSASKTQHRRVVIVKTFSSSHAYKGSLVVRPTGGKSVQIEGIGVAPF